MTAEATDQETDQEVVLVSRETASEKVVELAVPSTSLIVKPFRVSYVRASRWPEPLGWSITDIEAQPPGQGHGRRLMREILSWADANGHDLCIMAASTGPMDNEALTAWYERLGFAKDERGLLRRKARTTSDVT